MNTENEPMERGRGDAVSTADLARWREDWYRLASRIFLREPTDEELATLLGAAAEAVAEGAWDTPYEEALWKSLAALGGEEAPDGASLGTQVRTEYAELFVGPRPPLAPLYESLYVGYPRRLFTEVTKAARFVYERHGLTVGQRNRVPDDHMGYELLFMAELCAHEAEGLERGDEDAAARWATVQRDFLEGHLGRWSSLFCERVEAAPGFYYRLWARFVADFTAEDAQLIGTRGAC